MDPVIGVLVQMGGAGLVAAAVITLGRALAPVAVQLVPALAAARAQREQDRQQREDRLMDALLAATKAMTETAAVLQLVRADQGDLRDAFVDLRDFVDEMAQRLGQQRPPARRKKEAPANG